MRALSVALAAAALASCRVPGVLLPRGDLLHDVYLRGAADTPLVALTFDDGPNGRCTADVLDALAAMGARATFFVLGSNVDGGRSDALLARMVREGHAIGLHGYHHEGPLLVRPDVVREELAAGRRAVAAALARAGVSDPPTAHLYRPPFGLLTEDTAAAAAGAGFAIVEWTLSVGDWEPGRPAEAVVEAILARVRAGDVIVLHDGDRTHQRSETRCIDRPNAAAVVRLLVPALVARGLRPAPLGIILGFEGSSRVDLTAPGPAQ